MATSAAITRQAIIKDVNSLIHTVNDKTMIMLSVMSEVAHTLKDLNMESIWETIRQLSGTMHIHCIKPTARKAGNVQACYNYKDSGFISFLAKAQLAYIRVI